MLRCHPCASGKFSTTSSPLLLESAPAYVNSELCSQDKRSAIKRNDYKMQQDRSCCGAERGCEKCTVGGRVEIPSSSPDSSSCIMSVQLSPLSSGGASAAAAPAHADQSLCVGWQSRAFVADALE